jgi:HK97 family phage major capsid protein/HK97 family phage prohead protease
MAAVEKQARAIPRDNLVRAVFPADLELRDAPGAAETPTLTGHFAVFNEWTEINSMWEGQFMERIAPGAFSKTISENTSQMRVLFNHGSDPSIGDKVLGTIGSLTEDKTGARYEVPLFDTAYNAELLPGLRAGVYGASFRFTVMREEIVDEPKPSASNPRGLPERTIQEARVMEFGPVTFPAYGAATAGVRSMTDQYRLQEIIRVRPDLAERVDSEDMATLACIIQAGAQYIDDQDEPDDQKNIPVMESVLEQVAGLVAVEAAEVEPPEPEDDEGMEMASAPTAPDGETREIIATPEVTEAVTAAPPHPELRAGAPSRKTPEKTEDIVNNQIEEMLARIDELQRELKELAAENRGNLLSPDDQARWDAWRAEVKDLNARIKATEERQAELAELASSETHREVTVPVGTDTSFTLSRDNNLALKPTRDKAPDNPFALEEYHSRSTSQEHLGRLYTDGAKRAMEGMSFSDTRADAARAKENMEHVLNHDPNREVALRVLQYGSELYQRAFGKYLAGTTMTGEEQRSLGIGSQGGQMPVPIQIDPTVTLVSNGVINPLRQISRNVTMTGYEWRGVSTTGVTATYVAEGATSGDGSPTLLQPTIDAEQARVFVPFSFEVGMDWAGLESELGAAIADSKDVLEATAFLTGAGHASNLPKGVLRSASTVIGTALNSNAGTVFTVQNIYELENALPPRFRANASWVANRAVFQRIRQFDTAGGASLWVQLQNNLPPQLVGYNAYELSTMSTAVPSGSGASWGLFGDFSKFIIADRVGMSIELIPQVFAGNTAGGLSYPTGQRGLFAWWRNSSDVMSSNAFRAGTQS